MNSASLTAAHTAIIQIAKVQLRCLDFQPSPNSHLRVLFLESEFSKISITTPHVHHDILSAIGWDWKNVLHAITWKLQWRRTHQRQNICHQSLTLPQ